jgi:putative DNA primase/helicase
LRAAAREKACSLWDSAGSVDGKHAYLIAKQVKPVGIKQLNKQLVVPLCDAEGTLHSLQFIMPDGSKRFLTGGRKRGCHAMLGESFETICICEGWATGASIYQATSYTVAAAFDAGNLLPVAQALCKKYPKAKLVICADDDYQTEGNPGVTHARDAARAVNGVLAIPDFGGNRPEGATDFNDLHQHQGLDAVRQCIAREIDSSRGKHAQVKNNAPDAIPANRSHAGGEWPPLILPGTVKLPEIKADILPTWAGDMARALAADLQVSESAVILPTLSTIATAVQRRFEVAPRGDNSYLEPLNIWILTVAPSGSRKTPVLNALTDPLKRWEKLAGDRMRRQIAEVEATRRMIKKRIEKLETKAGNAEDESERNNLRDQIRAALEEMPEELKAPRLMTGDITPEQLQVMLVEQRERMALISDEAGIFQILSGQYSGGVAILDVFLQAYSGASVRIDRRTRQAFLEKPSLTFCLMLQPGILQSVASDQRFHDSGLLARFLFAIPQNTVGRRNVRILNPVPDEIKRGWHDGLHDLLIDAEKPSPEPRILPFTHKGRELWLDFAQQVEDELGENGKLYHMAEWGAKLPGACARIAGLMQLIKTGRHSERVEVGAVGRAVALCELLIEHAKAAFQLLGADEIEADALHLMKWIQANRSLEFNRSQAQKALEGRFRTVDRLKAAAKRLSEWNVLSPEMKRINKGARPTPFYRVNPQLFDNSINSL